MMRKLFLATLSVPFVIACGGEKNDPKQEKKPQAALFNYELTKHIKLTYKNGSHEVFRVAGTTSQPQNEVAHLQVKVDTELPENYFCSSVITSGDHPASITLEPNKMKKGQPDIHSFALDKAIPSLYVSACCIKSESNERLIYKGDDYTDDEESGKLCWQYMLNRKEGETIKISKSIQVKFQ